MEEEDDEACAICFDEDADVEDPIVICESCEVNVHKVGRSMGLYFHCFQLQPTDEGAM